MAKGGQGQGDGGVGGAAGGDGGVPEGGGVGGQQGRLGHGIKAPVYERVLSREDRAGSRGEKRGDDLASAPGNIDAGRKVRWTKRHKAMYAQPDAGLKDLYRWVLTRDKTVYAQHDQRI